MKLKKQYVVLTFLLIITLLPMGCSDEGPDDRDIRIKKLEAEVQSTNQDLDRWKLYTGIVSAAGVALIVLGVGIGTAVAKDYKKGNDDV